MPSIRGRKGVNLVEVLIGLLIVIIASLATLTYFSSALGGVGRQSNRRAALERARQRLEQLMAVPKSQLPTQDGKFYWCTSGTPCTNWVDSGFISVPVPYTGGVQVDNLASQRMEISARMIDDPSAGTGATLDVFELSAKVWFIPGSSADDDFHRVHIRTLRTPL